MLKTDHEPARIETAASAQTDKRAPKMDRDRGLGPCAASAGIAVVSLSILAASQFALAQSTDVLAPNSASSELTAEDYNFVAQANLGAPFQIDSGRVVETKATTSAIRDYAHLMVVTHIPVVNALKKILQKKHIKAPPSTLLDGAYHAMIASLGAEHGAALDRDYVDGQVEYLKGNAVLFRNESQKGYDPELKQFAVATLPKIDDHLRRALALAKDNKLGNTASK